MKKVQKNFKNNYASVECGAKILSANSEAKVRNAQHGSGFVTLKKGKKGCLPTCCPPIDFPPSSVFYNLYKYKKLKKKGGNSHKLQLTDLQKSSCNVS